MVRAVLLMILLAGCSDSRGEPTAHPPASAAIDAAPPIARPRVYFSGRGSVIVADADGYRRLGTDDARLYHVLPRADGTAWIGGDRLYRYDGRDLIAVDTGALAVTPVAETASGALWGTVDGGVAYFDGKTWRSWTPAEMGATTTTRGLGHLAVAPDGHAYVPLGEQLLIGDGATWRAVSVPGVTLDDVAVSATGAIVVSTDVTVGKARRGTLLRLDGDHLVELGKTERPGAILETQLDGSVLAPIEGVRVRDGALDRVSDGFVHAIGADGTIWTSSNDGMAVIARAPGGAKQRYPAKGKLEARVRGVVPERGGRTWILLESGLAVIDAGALVLLPPGTIPELPDELGDVVIAGDAPALPPFPVAKRITVRGRFVGPDGTPRKGVKVELCKGGSAVYYGKTPCAGEDPSWRATSAADGTFSIADLPDGGWMFHYAAKKDWQILLEYEWKLDGDLRLMGDIKLGK